jgi:acyl phosphate:glycerol-3-phosphate acyltransferase
MLYFTVIGYLWAAYMIGSIPTAVWIGKALHGVDVRDHGSGNAGATNTIRVLGWKTGVPVLLIDGIKGWLAVWFAGHAGLFLPGSDAAINFQLSMGISAVLGHLFPIWAGFRGGKGVATLFGVIIALYPVAFIIVAAIFIIILLSTRFVSLGSITAAIAFPFVSVFLVGMESQTLILFTIIIAVFIPLTHQKNIGRLLRGEESRMVIKRKN